MSVVGTENKIALKGQIRDLDIYINTLERQSKGFKTSTTNIQVQAKSLDTLGNTYKQLQDKAENARRVLAEGAGGDSNRANQAAKELISLTEQRRQLGQISAAEAIKDLQSIRTNTKISFEQQAAAAEAITKIRKGEGDRQVADIKTQQQQVQLLIDNGQISQADGERRLTNLKQKELEQRLTILKEAIAREKKEGRGNGDTAKDLVQQERQLQTELGKVRVDGLKKNQQIYIKDLETSLSKAADTVKASETSRLTQIQQLLNQGVISQKKAEELRLDAKRQSIQEDLKLEQQRLTGLLALPKAANPEDEEARQSKIRTSRQRTADLSLQLLQNEYDQQQKVKEDAIKAIDERLGAQTRASSDAIALLNQEKAAYEAIEKSIDSSLKLLESRASVQRALTNLQETQSQGELGLLQKQLEIQKEIDKTDSPEAKLILQKALNDLGVKGATAELDLILQRQELEDKIAQQKREATLAEQARARLSLGLELQKNKLAADRALIEAKIAENQAKQNLIAAQGNLDKAQQGKDQEAIKNAQGQVDLAQQGVKLASDNIKNAQGQVDIQPELVKNAQAVQEASQKAEIAQLNFSDKTREASQSMELAGIKAKEFADALKAAQEEARLAEQQSKTDNAPTPTSRFTGGPMIAGQPYLVGDGPGGQVIPGVSEVIVPGVSSYAIAARKVAELMSPPATSMAISSTPATGEGRLIREIQGLRQDLKNRKPVSNNQFTFNREDDGMGRLYQVMDVIRATMPL